FLKPALIAVFVASVVVAFFLGLSSTAGDVFIPESDRDFGEGWEQQEFQLTLPVINSTHEEIRIASIDSSCGCLSLSPLFLVVPAMGSAQIEIKLDLRFNPAETPEPREVVVQLAPHFEGSKQPPPVWTVKGRVRSPVRLKKRFAFLGDIVRGQPAIP